MFLLVGISLLGACHPLYEARYEFTLPDDQRGREGINDCRLALQHGETNAIQRSEGCRYRSRQAYQTCEARKRYAPESVKGWKKPLCDENSLSGYGNYCPDPRTEIWHDLRRFRDAEDRMRRTLRSTDTLG